MNEYIALLRKNRNYRFLWWGSVVSQLGDWFNLLASAELITDLTNSGVAISYLFLARFLPLFLFSPLAGVLADRYNRRTLMIISDLLRAVTVLGLLLVRSSQQIWLLYLLLVTQFALSALFTPARSAILSNTVARSDLVTANALDGLTWSTMLAMGAFLGGVVAAVFGARTAFVADAMTFLISAWLISQVAAAPVDESSAPEKRGGRSRERGGWLDFVDGFRYLRRETFILGISLIKATGSLVWGAINVLEVTIADEMFPMSLPVVERVLQIDDPGTATLGIIYMVVGIGTGLGPLFVRRWLGDKPTRLFAGIAISFAMTAIGILGIGVATNITQYLFVVLVRAVGTGTIWVFSAALLQMIVPDRFRGRVFAFEFALLTLTQSLSIYWAGFAQDGLGLDIRQVATITGLFGLAVGLVWSLFILRNASRIKTASYLGAGS